MTAIDKAAETAKHLWLHEEVHFDMVARAVFASIDTDELADALALTLPSYIAKNAAEAVKAHLLKEDA